MKHNFLLPAHFKTPLELALQAFESDGFIFSEAVIGEVNDQFNFKFEVEATPNELFQLGVKVGYRLREQSSKPA